MSEKRKFDIVKEIKKLSREEFKIPRVKVFEDERRKTKYKKTTRQLLTLEEDDDF